MAGAIMVPEGRVTGRLDTVEMVLILFILCLWAFVIRIFLNKWGESMSGLAKSKYFYAMGVMNVFGDSAVGMSIVLCIIRYHFLFPCPAKTTLSLY